MEDADANTKIQVEEGSNDDIIRFDMAGTEFFRMDSGRLEILNTGESVFIGEGAGTNDDYTNNSNVFVGNGSGYFNTTGEANTANGYRSLYVNTTGSENTATGYESLYLNTTGSFNTASGQHSLYSNTTGSSNTANGYESLTSNVGDANSASGYRALFSNGNGVANSAFGHSALYNNSSGNWNTALGYEAGEINTTGTDIACLGWGADVSSAALSDATAIGESASVNASNKVRIGNSGITVIEGQVAYSYPSDERFKFNVNDDVPGLDFITELNPVTYQFDTKKFDEHVKQNYSEERKKMILEKSDYGPSTEIIHTGFIAQDIEKICQKLGYDFDGLHIPDASNPTDNYSVAYSQFIMPLVKAVQEQQEQIEKLNPESVSALKEELEEVKAKNELLENKLNQVLDRLDGFDSDLQQCCFNYEESSSSTEVIRNNSDESGSEQPILEQNAPNPFRENTVIKYYLPSSARTAELIISDQTGTQLKAFDLQGKGFGQVLISGGSFRSGTYIYTLVINGERVFSKQMIML